MARRWRADREVRRLPAARRARVELLAERLGCPLGEAAVVERSGTVLEVGEGRVLLREGHFGRQWIVLLDGGALVVRAGTVLGILGPGNFVGEVGVRAGRTCTATVTTVTPSRVLVLDPRAFVGLRWSAPALWQRIEETATQRAHTPDVLVAVPSTSEHMFV